jgi:predicted dehydrogenase
MSKVSWGVLSTAKIGLDRVIAPMQKAPNLSIDAIASRDHDKAKAAAAQFGIARAYGSYEELLADKAIEAIYIPVPNHLHVEWAERAAAAGKHVLLEKPLAMSADEGKRLIAAREKSGKVIVEGFMVASGKSSRKAGSAKCAAFRRMPLTSISIHRISATASTSAAAR